MADVVAQTPQLFPLPVAEDERLSRLRSLYESNAKRTRVMFENDTDAFLQSQHVKGTKDSISIRALHAISSQYAAVKHIPPPAAAKAKQQPAAGTVAGGKTQPHAGGRAATITMEDEGELDATTIINDALVNSSKPTPPPPASANSASATSSALTVYQPPSASLPSASAASTALLPFDLAARSTALSSAYSAQYTLPVWHPPWRLLRVMAGHQGWVRSVAVDPSNEFLVSGSADRTIKCWDLATGALKLTLTGHVSGVRCVRLSERHPYMFSAAEDKTVRCWDLESNKVIRNYHGHLSGVYTLAIHPTLDILISGGRDSTARVWDMRTKTEVAVLGGHTNTVASLLAQSVQPQLVSGSHDTTMRLWDLRTSACLSTLTHHKHSVRAMVFHPTEYTWASAATDAVKVWKCPSGTFLRNCDGHRAILNSLCVNRSSLLVSGGNDGSLGFTDWRSGHTYDLRQTVAQSGTLEGENAIFDTTFDATGSRLLTAEGDKTIKVYREDEDATEQSHPGFKFKPPKRRRY